MSVVLESQREQSKHVVLITSNASRVPNYDADTGNWLEELAAPFFVLREAGFRVEIASPAGGPIPIDSKSRLPMFYWAAAQRMDEEDKRTGLLSSTVPLSAISPSVVCCVFLVGGHGAYAFAEDQEVQRFIEEVYRLGGVVAGVCHGPAGLVHCKREEGGLIVEGKHVTAFTNEEERSNGTENKVPFLLEDKLREAGALFEKKSEWSDHVVVDGRLVTGQNNFSATLTARKVLEVLLGREGPASSGTDAAKHAKAESTTESVFSATPTTVVLESKGA